MASRKTRRNTNVKESTEVSSKAIKRLIFMLIAVGLMIFSISQVYFLARYTLGQEVPANKLKIYRWVQLLVNGDTGDTLESNVEE